MTLLWEATYFLRIWRHWLWENGHSETDHFITANAYTCIELNSHMLIGIIYNIIHGKLPKEALRIWTAGSQGCEQIFRLLRSMTPVFSTIINFTLKGILERIHKLNYLSSIESCDEIIFPRVKKRLLQLNEESELTFQIPTLDDLEKCVSEAKDSTMALSKRCGMVLELYDDVYIAKDTMILIENAIECDHEDEGNANSSSSPDDDVEMFTQAEITTIKEDMTLIRLQRKSNEGLPTYAPSKEKGTVARKSYSKKTPFIQYKDAHIRKQPRCTSSKRTVKYQTIVSYGYVLNNHHTSSLVSTNKVR